MDVNVIPNASLPMLKCFPRLLPDSRSVIGSSCIDSHFAINRSKLVRNRRVRSAFPLGCTVSQQVNGPCASSWQSQAALVVGDLTVPLGAHVGSEAFLLVVPRGQVPGKVYTDLAQDSLVASPSRQSRIVPKTSDWHLPVCSGGLLRDNPISVEDTEPKTSEAPSPSVSFQSREVHLPQHPVS